MSELQLLIGTGNRGKIREITAALTGLPLIVRTLEEFPELTAPTEDADTYEGNARIKAQYYANQTGLTTLADDSGLEVGALGGRPGVHSARYGGDGLSDEDRVRLLLDELKGHENRNARFVCAMVLEGNVETFVQETVEGTLTTEPHGSGGFGYDPIFVPNGYDQTFGVLPAELKQRISHRGKALASIRRFLESQIVMRRQFGRPA
jgi:XTP/dITP diphosphohydrolase